MQIIVFLSIFQSDYQCCYNLVKKFLMQQSVYENAAFHSDATRNEYEDPIYQNLDGVWNNDADKFQSYFANCRMYFNQSISVIEIKRIATLINVVHY